MIYDISSQGEFSKDVGLRSQTRNASVSIMSNIAEGFDRGSDKEFTQFHVMARGSASEVKSHLYVALDRKYLNENEFKMI